MDKNIIFIRFLHILKVAKYGRVTIHGFADSLQNIKICVMLDFTVFSYIVCKKVRSLRERVVMTDEELKEAYQLFTGLWKLVYKNHNNQSDQEWKRLTDQAAEMVKQYGEDVRPLVLDTMEYIERRCKK